MSSSLFRLDENQAFLISAKAVVRNEEGKILLVRVAPDALAKEYRELWDLPGGLIEHDEQVADGLKREIREEIGLEAHPVDILAVSDHVIENFTFHNGQIKSARIVLLFFQTELRSFATTLSPEHSELIWATKEEFSQMDLVPYLASVREKILA